MGISARSFQPPTQDTLNDSEINIQLPRHINLRLANSGQVSPNRFEFEIIWHNLVTLNVRNLTLAQDIDLFKRGLVRVSLGSRLKEERLRLGLNQTDLASVADSSKGAQINWEKDVNSPPAAALAAYAAAGVDVLYVLTGKRLPDILDATRMTVRDDLADIERELIDPARVRRPDETDEQAEARVIAKARSTLANIIKHDATVLPADLIDRAEALLQAANDSQRLSQLRAADFAQARKRREEEKELLAIWLESCPYRPDHSVMDILARIALEYSVPHRTLADLLHEIHTDIEEQRMAEIIIKQADGEA